ncbi:CPBP family intramembrane glutamic endopeptidase [Pseudolysinimonas yzui]|uniref:CAAX amino protease n=1 Tax=Pseudolysinimonas yzui TaxID=2708254 RepID=A0A8J3GT72_9MICO|nr:type II CAAX endopeptidase family protein [Pseudolysinimonas yzui]GHF26131.1 CAAX amino protease [Pseudolysinimonas yzui]
MTDAAAPTPSTPAEPDVTIVELPYHRLYRAQPTYRWWRPLVAVLMAAVFFLGISILLAVPLFIVLYATGAIDFLSPTATDDLVALISPDMARPWTLVFGLGSIILVLPFVPLALRIAGIRPSGVRVNILHSVLFTLRWRWLLVCLIPATVVWVATFAGQLGIGLALGEELLPFSTDVPTYLLSVLIVLLLVPVQAATEEYLYRGILLQSVGAWVRWAPVTIIVSAVLFGFSHAYDSWGILTVMVMGIGFAVVTIRTGGLEAGIAMHTVNNVAAFVVTGTGMFGPTGITEDTGGPAGLVAQVITVGLWMLGVEWFARRNRIERLSRIGIPTPPVGMLPPYGS